MSTQVSTLLLFLVVAVPRSAVVVAHATGAPANACWAARPIPATHGVQKTNPPFDVRLLNEYTRVEVTNYRPGLNHDRASEVAWGWLGF